MSLTIGERRKLRKIERALARTDPPLVARYAIFARIIRREDMPSTERLRVAERLSARLMHRGTRTDRNGMLWTAT